MAKSTDINALPEKVKPILTTKELGFPSAIAFDGDRDHEGKFSGSRVWLVVQVGKETHSLFIGTIASGVYQPIDDLVTGADPAELSVSDFSAFLSGDRKIGKLAVSGLAESITRIVRHHSRADYDADREQSRVKSEATIRVKSESRYAAVKAAIGLI
jgi:hypothetical protein